LPGSAHAIGARDRGSRSGLAIGARACSGRGRLICCPDWGTDGLLRIRRIGSRPEVAHQVSSRLIETVRARERAGHQHVGAGRLRNDCWRCGANQNDLPAQSARIAEIVMFRPVRLTPPWLLRGSYPGQQPTAWLRRNVQPIWAMQAYCRSAASPYTDYNLPNSDSQSSNYFASNRSETITAPRLENTFE